jgi:hypothetical protein
MQNKLLKFLIIPILAMTFTAYGQKQVNSSLARFNMGVLEPAGSFRSIAMGGTAIGMRDNNSIYFSNPASYSSLDTNSFVFDFGIDYSMNYISNGTEKYSSDDMNFDHLIMGFPLSKGWGMAMGVVPISNSYYSIYESMLKSSPNYNPVVGEYSSLHTGSGGFNNYFIGTGVKFLKHFSLGINMSILSGDISRVNQVAFADYNYVFNDNSSEKLHIGGVNFDYGFQYMTDIKKDWFFNAGVSFTSPKHYNSSYQSIATRFTAYKTDTIRYSLNEAGDAYIPGTVRIGLSFGKKNKLTAGLDFISTPWSKAKIPGAEGYTADTKALMMGLEFIPDKFSNYSLLKRMEYRIGGHVESNYLIINGNQVKEYGASAGIGVPLRHSYSKVNLFFDFTNKSLATTSGTHNENFYTLGISLNLWDLWFMKRKYD